MLTLKPVRYASRALMSLAFNQAEAEARLRNMRVEKSTGSSKTLGTILRDPILPSSAGQVGSRMQTICSMPAAHKIKQHLMFCKHFIFHGCFAQRLAVNKPIVFT